MHREVAGLQDVDAIDLFDRSSGHGEGNGFFFDDGSEDLAVLFGYLFGVVQQRMVELVRENYGGGEYRSGIAASSGFIAAGFASILF